MRPMRNFKLRGMPNAASGLSDNHPIATHKKTAGYDLFEKATHLGWSKEEQDQLKLVYSAALGFDQFNGGEQA